MNNSNKRAKLEFYLEDKKRVPEIIERVRIIYNDTNYSIAAFMRTFFNGEPFNFKDNITGEDILRLIDKYAEKLYPEEYHQLEMDSAIHTALIGKKNSWIRKLLAFLGMYFSIYDVSTWDIDINEGVLSFIPESGKLKSKIRQDIIQQD